MAQPSILATVDKLLGNFLPGAVKWWMVALALVVGFGLRILFKQFVGLTATPVLFAVLAALYAWKNYGPSQGSTSAKKASLAAQLTEGERQHVNMHLKVQNKLAAVGGSSSMNQTRHSAVRSGDSFDGPVPRAGRGTFKGDQEWFKPGSETARKSEQIAAEKGKPRQKLSHSWKVKTKVREGSGEGEGEAAGAEAGAGSAPRAALPAAVPANVDVMPTGRRLYKGRTAAQLARRRNRLKVRKSTTKRLRGVTEDEEEVGAMPEVTEVSSVGVQESKGAGRFGDGTTVAEVVAQAAEDPAEVPWASVQELLTQLELQRYAGDFAAEEVTIELLVGMATDKASLLGSLKEIGVAKMGHREAIAQAVMPYSGSR